MASLVSIIRSLLPNGPIWSDDNPIIPDIIDQIAGSLRPLLEKAGKVRREFYPTTANQVDRWLADFGVTNRADLLRKIIQKGSQSRTFYTGLVSGIVGTTVRIEVVDPVPVGRMRSGSRLTSEFRYVTFVIYDVPPEKRQELAQILESSVPPYMRFAIA